MTLPRPLPNISEGSDTNTDETDRPVRGQLSKLTQAHHVNNAAPQRGRHRQTSSLGVPPSSLPERRSSKNLLRRKQSHASRLSTDVGQQPPQYLPQNSGQIIPPRGSSTSPVRSAAARLNHISSEVRRIPSRTFVRSCKPTDILDIPKISHPRVSAKIRIAAPLFMGGGTVEGHVTVVIDEGKANSRPNSRPAMFIGRISVDILGVESSHCKQHIFRSIANELIDDANPPPKPMIASSRALSDAYWEVTPSTSVLPFRLDLPVNMGPPPYSSKHAGIRYLLCTTLSIRISGKQDFVRRSQEIAILTVHDRMSSCSVSPILA